MFRRLCKQEVQRYLRHRQDVHRKLYTTVALCSALISIGTLCGPQRVVTSWPPACQPFLADVDATAAVSLRVVIFHLIAGILATIAISRD